MFQEIEKRGVSRTSGSGGISLAKGPRSRERKEKAAEGTVSVCLPSEKASSPLCGPLDKRQRNETEDCTSGRKGRERKEGRRGKERKRDSRGLSGKLGLFKSITMLTVGLLCPRLSNR